MEAVHPIHVNTSTDTHLFYRTKGGYCGYVSGLSSTSERVERLTLMTKTKAAGEVIDKSRLRSPSSPAN